MLPPFQEYEGPDMESRVNHILTTNLAIDEDEIILQVQDQGLGNPYQHYSVEDGGDDAQSTRRKSSSSKKGSSGSSSTRRPSNGKKERPGTAGRRRSEAKRDEV